MKLKTTVPLLLLGLIFSVSLQAQKIDTQYEPSAQYPFGRSNPNLGDQLKAFAPIVGNCECRSLTRNADQSWGDTTNLRWEFRYIMNGTAVQDITWLDNDTYTTSVRQYNADSTQWYVTFFGSSGPVAKPQTWVGGVKESDIVLYNEQKAPNGTDGFYRITFKDIGEKGFNWRGEWVDKAEKFVYPTWLIWCTKTRQ